MKVKVPLKGNKVLGKILDIVNEDVELNTIWKCGNRNAVDRMKINDHGIVHITIVSNIALKLHRMLQETDATFNVVEDNGYTMDDSEVVVFLAACMHDIGHAIHRKGHDEFGLHLARPILERILDGVYSGEKKYTLLFEILHAMIAHSTTYGALTLEGGIVRVSDGLDMKGGRARIPFKRGSVSIHSLSALAISDVKIKKGDPSKGQHPIHVEIKMANPAGIYQLDNLLKLKIKNSGLEKYLGVEATFSKTDSHPSVTYNI